MSAVRQAAQFVRGIVTRGLFADAIRIALHRVFNFNVERRNRAARFVLIVEEYKAGVLVNTIAAKHGCTRGTVQRYARLAGLPPRPKGSGKVVEDLCVQLYLMEVPIKDIADELEVSQAYVSKTATKHGINRRKFKKRAT